MSKLTRRDFLARSGQVSAGAAAFSLTGCPADGTPPDETPPEEQDPAGPWGTPGDEKQAEALLPEDKRPEGVLEFFLWGGVNAFDSFYVIPEHGDPAAGGPFAGEGWWVFQEGDDNVSDTFYNRCDGGDRELLEPWVLDGAGKQVNIGPYAYPLRERPDLLARMRMFAMGHGLAPHQAAVPAALTGHIPGNPRLTGFGSHVERYWQDRQEGSRSAPYSWLLLPDRRDVASHNTDAGVATGLHPARARPTAIKIGSDTALVDLLLRSNLSDRSDEVDAALAHYMAAYGQRYVPPGGDAPVRAPALGAYEAALSGLNRADALRALLPNSLLQPTEAESCTEVSDLDLTTMQLKLAAHLLTQGDEKAKYVSVIDGGMLPATLGAAFDTHRYHVVETMRNLIHSLKALASIINEPGENDPAKLDLDRHQVVITTEFGRSPMAGEPDGLNHWPWGYVQMILGGWVDEDRSGIVGYIPESGYADQESLTPTEFRAGLALGMGIWPFNQEAFAVGDTRIETNRADAGRWLREHMLGY